jgi:glycosyltransferase involved in cell wall biosynthesis
MVSVCMATKNGAAFIREQLDSIVHQLNEDDEIIIFDDFSTDDTISIVQSFHDRRIRLIESSYERGVVRNFEDSLKSSNGDYIFLADQDDVWLPGKVLKMKNHLKTFDLVMCDCQLVDVSLQQKKSSFYNVNNSGKGLVKNLIKNSYMGCCMAFTKQLKERSLPFPADTPMHDFWLGLIGELYFKVHFMQEVLVLHRRHESNASTTGRRSERSIRKKLSNRLRLVKNLFIRKYYAG